MIRQVSIAILIALLSVSAGEAQNRQRSRRSSNNYRNTIRLVQNEGAADAPAEDVTSRARDAARRAAEAARRRSRDSARRALTDPVDDIEPLDPPEMYGLDDYNQVNPVPDNRQARARARRNQPVTMGHIFDDDNYEDEYCEQQFCEHVWACAGGRCQPWWARWQREFCRTYHVVWTGGCGGGCLDWLCNSGGCGGGCLLGGCGCGGGSCSSCSAECGCGTGGCGTGGCGAGYGYMDGGYADMPRGGRSVARDPYVNALEAGNPNTEVVGRVQILQDKVLR